MLFSFFLTGVTHTIMTMSRSEESLPFSCHGNSLPGSTDRETYNAVNATQRESQRQHLGTRSRALPDQGNK